MIQGVVLGATGRYPADLEMEVARCVEAPGAE